MTGTATMTARKPKPEPTPIDIPVIAAKGELWVRPCEFDHAHVDVQSWVLLEQDGDQTYKSSWTTYDGLLSKSKPRELELQQRTISSRLVEVTRLIRKGYQLWEPPTTIQKRGRPKKK